MIADGGEYQIAHLDLGNNNLGSAGLSHLLKGILRNTNLVSLDLGSNDLMTEASSTLFKSLKSHPSIAILNLANHDRLHRNRIGVQACHDLRDLLKCNRILSHLNIADCRIGNDGLTEIAPALSRHCTLAILNLENNDLEGTPAANTLNNYLNCNQNILDLKLAGNKIGDTAMNKLVDFIRKGMS